jgi:hypothetical protein
LLASAFFNNPLLRCNNSNSIDRSCQQHAPRWAADFQLNCSEETKRKHCSADNAEYLPASLLHESSPKRRFSGACRLAVESVISAFKQTAFGNDAVADGKLHCAGTEQVVTMADAHVDHAPPYMPVCVLYKENQDGGFAQASPSPLLLLARLIFMRFRRSSSSSFSASSSALLAARLRVLLPPAPLLLFNDATTAEAEAAADVWSVPW